MIDIVLPAIPMAAVTIASLLFIVVVCGMLGLLAYDMWIKESPGISILLIACCILVIVSFLTIPDTGVQVFNITQAPWGK